jgi:hypothetical protein
MAQFDERRALIEREEVPRPIAELFGDVAGIVRECLGGVARFPAAAILQRPAASPSDRASGTERYRWRGGTAGPYIRVKSRRRVIS